MTIVKLREAMIASGHDVFFTYAGKKCGVASEVKDSSFIFESWCETKVKQYTDFDKLLHDPFFDGKSLQEFLNEVEINFI